MLRIFLLRHGNTFEAGAPVLRVGRHEDPPLTARGEDQAHTCAAALRRLGERPARVLAGPLKRTRRSAEIVVADLDLDVRLEVDERLTEIDYGAWGGLTDAEIAARFGGGPLDAWNRSGVWPPAGVWGESESDVRGRVHEFVRGLSTTRPADGAILVVSSNGTLRYFLELAAHPGVSEAERKMKTGHMGRLDWDGEKFALRFWNADPGALGK